MGGAIEKNMTIVYHSKMFDKFKILGFLVFYITLSPITIYSPSLMQCYAYICLCLILFSLRQKKIFDPKIRNYIHLSIFLFIFAFLIPSILHMESPFLTDLLQWFSFFFIVGVKHEYRVFILQYALKFLYIVTIFSIIEYLIGYFSGYTFNIAHIDANDRSYTQSFFNLYRYGNLRYRFTSLSNEPGTLGALCGFIIAFLPFKKQYFGKIFVFTIAGILSLSLAFYIYLFTILLFKTVTKQVSIRYFVITIMAIGFIIFLFKDAATSAIVERLSERDDIESIDNRTGDQVNKFIYHIFDSPNAIYGVGNRTAYKLEENSGSGNAGLKWKIFQYGIFGVGFYFWGLILLLKKRRNMNVSMTFTLLFFGLYFYSVGSWGLPIFVLLMFTTLPVEREERTVYHKKKFIC